MADAIITWLHVLAITLWIGIYVALLVARPVEIGAATAMVGFTALTVYAIMRIGGDI